MSEKKLPSGPSPRHWLTLRETSELLGVHYTTLRTWADNGEIPVFRTPGGHRRFRVEDVRRFLEARAETHAIVNVDSVISEALGRIRQEIAGVPVQPGGWRTDLDESSRASDRERGRKLFALALNFVMRPEQREKILADGRSLGQEYGREAARREVSLAETGRAVQFFRRQLLEAVRRDETLDPQDVQIRQTIAAFLDEVLYAVLDGYEQALGA